MKISDLIGKRIADIQDKIEPYGMGNELLSSSGVFILESGGTFEIPYRNSETLAIINTGSFAYTSIFNEDALIKRLFSKAKYNRKIARRNKKAIKGKSIIQIYQYDESNEENHYEALEKLIFEVESGYLFSEISMAPFGTGAVGILVFTSKKEIFKRFGSNLKQLFE